MGWGGIVRKSEGEGRGGGGGGGRDPLRGLRGRVAPKRRNVCCILD